MKQNYARHTPKHACLFGYNCCWKDPWRCLSSLHLQTSTLTLLGWPLGYLNIFPNIGFIRTLYTNMFQRVPKANQAYIRAPNRAPLPLNSQPISAQKTPRNPFSSGPPNTLVAYSWKACLEGQVDLVAVINLLPKSP